MSLNLTEEVALQFTWFEASMGIGTTFLILLPTLLLSLVGIATIKKARRVDRKLKVILTNILATDLLFSINEISRGFHPLLELFDVDITIPCKLYYYVHSTVLDAQVFSITLYSACIFVILKFGEKKLKWKHILPTISISWLIFIALNPLVLQDSIEVNPALGICWFSAPTANSLTRTILTWTFDGFLFPISSILFSVLAHIHVRKNVIEMNGPVQKGMLKNLVFLLIVSGLDFLQLVVPSIITIPTKLPPITSSNIWSTLVPLTVIYVLFNMTSIMPPVTTMVFIKPVRRTLKACSCNKE